MSRPVRVLFCVALCPAIVVLALLVLRVAGLLCPYNIPTGAMAPAVSAGDHVLMEGLSYVGREPQRGDIAVFTSDAMPFQPKGTTYTKRIAGEPGDRLRLVDGKFFVNERHVPLKNEQGEIHYMSPPGVGMRYLISSNDVVVVPAGQYFLLGDNSANSADSRFFGFVPRKEIKGRVWFCYWPPARFGAHE